MKLSKKIINTLAENAITAKSKSYSPYSKFKVGASVITSDGEIFNGCNIENESYSLTICAERSALFNSFINGKKNIFAIAITSDDKNFLTPCGACLQVISELAPNAKLILVNNIGKIKLTTLKKLFPNPPDLKFLAS
ncbi:MAG: cytidine deaminase [Bacteroidetes bacterium]|nr:cytidine deaminase [Bacteroidota bacterium]